MSSSKGARSRSSGNSTRILRCLECWIGAVWADVDLFPDAIVECNNCHEKFILKDLLEKQHEKPS